MILKVQFGYFSSFRSARSSADIWKWNSFDKINKKSRKNKLNGVYINHCYRSCLICFSFYWHDWVSWCSNSVLHFEVSLSMSDVCIAKKKLFCHITKFMPQLFVITFWENVVFTNILILTVKLMAVPKWMTEMKVSDKSDTFKNSMSKVSNGLKFSNHL